ncbi:CCA tRNA nucleotidyltransferase [Paenibacillus sp. FSL H8-0034]|uniref:CCA tRNA nucleotidyltransferase n=1 Tax=Paenibacillus sp. FSL H8-0034 TaxID=2954671 RepID=UPI0030FBC561
MKEMMEQGAYSVLTKLQEQGYEAYLVGGCVRDKQLLRPVKDYDIATSAKPEQVLELFERTIPTGLQHGTVTVVLGAHHYEVTTFRKEAAYEQFRRPAEVQFIDSLHEDLQRRDFTMNAMALDQHGNLIDPFGGLADMEHGLLRCVGNASERFTEDALRMLRCIRFSAEYGLEVEAATWKALCEHSLLLKHIAMERVRMELERMIAGADPLKALRLLVSSGILRETKQALKLAQLDPVHMPAAIHLLLESDARWTYLFLSIGLNAAEIEADMRVLTFSVDQIKRVYKAAAAFYMLRDGLLLNQPEYVQEPTLEKRLEHLWKLGALTYGKAAWLTLYDILAVEPRWMVSHGITVEAGSIVLSRGKEWLDALIVDSLKQLQVGGKELLAHMNKPPGPWVTEVLNHLLQETALGRSPNETGLLIAEAEQFVKYHNL